MFSTRSTQLLALATVTLLFGGMRPADDLDAFIETQMARREIVGLSLAIIDDGKIVETRAYGTTTRGGSEKVTPTTLFQAGSISKPVAALGALTLVEQGKLSLDEDVNTKLKSWQVPDNEFTTTERVTLRRLLSHSAGLTVHGFPGYDVNERVPSVVDVLEGKGNTAAVRVNVVPGSIWRYSGGGYTVMQQLVVDVTGRSFPDYMNDAVLKPLGMTSSTYQQPLPASLAAKTAQGYYTNRKPVSGKWHVYPEMAAAGLWTTPSDLARYAIGVQQALAGKSKVLSADMAKQMLTVQKGSYGLGPALAGTGLTLRFSHGGRDEGFDAFLMSYAESGDGAVIMINANDNSRTMGRIMNFIAKKYNWPSYPLPQPEAVTPANVTADALAEFTGRYEESNNVMFTLIAQNGRLFTVISGLPDEEWMLAADGRIVSTERSVSLRPVRNASARIDHLEVTVNGSVVAKEPRIGPLFTTSTVVDPDPAFTANVTAVLRQLAEGNAAVTESKLLTEGARKAFTRPNPEMRDARALRLVHVEDVAGRGIERHGHAVTRVLHYRMTTANGEQMLLIHAAADGLVTDYDIVDR